MKVHEFSRSEFSAGEARIIVRDGGVVRVHSPRTTKRSRAVEIHPSEGPIARALFPNGLPSTRYSGAEVASFRESIFDDALAGKPCTLVRKGIVWAVVIAASAVPPSDRPPTPFPKEEAPAPVAKAPEIKPRSAKQALTFVDVRRILTDIVSRQPKPVAEVTFIGARGRTVALIAALTFLVGVLLGVNL